MIPSELKKQLGEIRAKVERDGGYTVECEELRILCPGYMTVAEQFARIAAIARQEGWSFAFLPQGMVHFGTYQKHGSWT